MVSALQSSLLKYAIAGLMGAQTQAPSFLAGYLGARSSCLGCQFEELELTTLQPSTFDASAPPIEHINSKLAVLREQSTAVSSPA